MDLCLRDSLAVRMFRVHPRMRLVVVSDSNMIVLVRDIVRFAQSSRAFFFLLGEISLDQVVLPQRSSLLKAFRTNVDLW